MTFNPGWSTGGAVYSGRAALTFSNSAYATATITGQSTVTTDTRIVATIYADSDDVLAEDWNAVKVFNIVVGVGFSVLACCRQGRFNGTLQVDWRLA